MAILDTFATFGEDIDMDAETASSKDVIDGSDVLDMQDIGPNGTGQGTPIYLQINVTEAFTDSSAENIRFYVMSGTALSSGSISGGTQREVCCTPEIRTQDLTLGARFCVMIMQQTSVTYQRYWQLGYDGDAADLSAGKISAYLSFDPAVYEPVVNYEGS